ncbi:MAG: cysteine desulfurase [Micrococcales bacterium]|nr:MAG: cysteine desulfurase [Micrococcales bacterium]PIE26008.1 MAG: cysteine desulfurase [Micrococcales bacterium]
MTQQDTANRAASGTASGSQAVLPALDVETVKADFPILTRDFADDQRLIYLDSANTSQKPRQVIQAITEHYELHNANVARAVHRLGEESTAAFEQARQLVAAFIGAQRPEEVVFTKNASEALNLVARVLCDEHGSMGVKPGDEIVVSQMEHHSNLVPWQLILERTGARLRWFGITDEGRLDLDGDQGSAVGAGLDDLITERTKVVSLTWVSNVLGTVNPIQRIAQRAHEVGAVLVVDASQAVPQMPVDVAELGADLIAFTGHKMLGPTGVGVLWGRYDLLAALPPFLGGGEMIEDVQMEMSTYAPPPHRFEAGTPPIAQAVGLGAAVQYLNGLGMAEVRAHEQRITAYTLDALSSVTGLHILGPATAVDRGGAIAFTLDGVHPHDVAQVLDSLGVAVRAGHHCAKPLHHRFGVQASTRVSPYLYSGTEDIDALVDGLEYVKSVFG